MKQSFTKEQRQIATENRMPLASIGFDDRHIPKEHGGKYGAVHFYGPIPAEFLPEFYDLFWRTFKANAGKDSAA